MNRLFGTDGVRGVANDFLTPELAFALGRAGGFVLASHGARRPVLVGRDTRVSGPMLEDALCAPRPPHHAVPRRQPRVHLLDALIAV